MISNYMNVGLQSDVRPASVHSAYISPETSAGYTELSTATRRGQDSGRTGHIAADVPVMQLTWEYNAPCTGLFTE